MEVGQTDKGHARTYAIPLMKREFEDIEKRINVKNGKDNDGGKGKGKILDIIFKINDGKAPGFYGSRHGRLEFVDYFLAFRSSRSLTSCTSRATSSGRSEERRVGKE